MQGFGVFQPLMSLNRGVEWGISIGIVLLWYRLVRFLPHIDTHVAWNSYDINLVLSGFLVYDSGDLSGG